MQTHFIPYVIRLQDPFYRHPSKSISGLFGASPNNPEPTQPNAYPLAVGMATNGWMAPPNKPRP